MDVGTDIFPPCCEYIAGAANTVNNAVLWISVPEKGSLIVFSSHNVILITDATSRRIICSLRGHKNRINALSVLSVSDDVVEIVSGGEDNTVKLWRHLCMNGFDIWSEHSTNISFATSVTSLACLSFNNVSLICASDRTGVYRTFYRKSVESAFSVIDDGIMLPAQTPNRLSFTLLRSNYGDVKQFTILLLLGCVDSKIYFKLSCLESIEEFCAVPSNNFPFTFGGYLIGHEEWITSLDSMPYRDGVYFLASGSKDSKIRVWRIESQEKPQQPHTDHSQSILPTDASLSSNAGDLKIDNLADEDDEDDEEAEEEGGTPAQLLLEDEEAATEARLTCQGRYFSHAVFLEALLVGHEDWVSEVVWLPRGSEDAPCRLFSTSMDRNMVIWEPDSLSGVWTPSVRVGDIGGYLGGSVGANLLGFIGGCVAPDGGALLGIGYGGSFHWWTRGNSTGAEERWSPLPLLTGHFAPVNDLVWAANGEFLATVSSDQTCRIFAPTRQQKMDGEAERPHWCEVSRPQVHGYDLNALVLMPDPRAQARTPVEAHTAPPPLSNLVLITAGDEKVIRVFDAPALVADGLQHLCGVHIAEQVIQASRIQRAYIPELGLSNKASDLMSKQEASEQDARHVAAVDWSQPPLESQLADYTIWPETKKVFGHSNDVMCLAVSADGRWLASACKARDSSTAAVHLWEADRMSAAGTTGGHDSTVVAIKFSPDGRFLATAGKDRTLCLHAATASRAAPVPVPVLAPASASNEAPFALCAGTKGAHKRIIWDMSWARDSSLLATVSRDGMCKIWRVREDPEAGTETATVAPSTMGLSCIHCFSPFGGASVTAVDLGRHLVLKSPRRDASSGDESSEVSRGWLAALGSEEGDIGVWLFSDDGSRAVELFRVGDAYAHGAAVKRLKFSSSEGDGARGIVDGGDEWCRLASCGDDHCVRVFRLGFAMN